MHVQLPQSIETVQIIDGTNSDNLKSCFMQLLTVWVMTICLLMTDSVTQKYGTTLRVDNEHNSMSIGEIT